MKWFKSKTDKLQRLISERGFFGSTVYIINSILQGLAGIQIVRKRSISSNRTAKRVFGKCSLKVSKNGYYYLSPMPTEEELNEYYESIYWASRNGKNSGTTARDLIHFDILNQKCSEFKKDKVFLNFGAGHGGMSHLAWHKGLNVINVEPSGLPDWYESRWKTYKSIYKVPSNTINILYGSHSLEHVQNIEKFINELKRILMPNGIMFWEVPNGDYETNGAKNGKVDIPHTYYFKKAFFDYLFEKVILNEGFEQSHRHEKIENWAKFKNPNGEVLRAMGRF